MKEYLKMADVFEDGVTLSNAYVRAHYNDSSSELNWGARMAGYAAHAINSHDELVAEVERLRADNEKLLTCKERRKRRAVISETIFEDMVKFFESNEFDHDKDSELKALCERIAGNEVTLVFTGDDAFEIQDDNYWIPDHCYKLI